MCEAEGRSSPPNLTLLSPSPTLLTCSDTLPALDGADTGPHWPHGEPTSIDMMYALSIVQGSWEAAQAAATSEASGQGQQQRRTLGLQLPPKRGRESGLPPEPPLSPLSHPATYSPTRPAVAEAEPPPSHATAAPVPRRGSFGDVSSAPASASASTMPMLLDLKVARGGGQYGGGGQGGGSTPDLLARGAPPPSFGAPPHLYPINTTMQHSPSPYGGGGGSGGVDLPPGIGRSPSFGRPLLPTYSNGSALAAVEQGGMPLPGPPSMGGGGGTGFWPSSGGMPRVSSLSGYGSAPNSASGTPMHASASAGSLLSSPPYQRAMAAEGGGGGAMPGPTPPPSGPATTAASAPGGDSTSVPIWEGWTRPVSLNHPETWESPDESFELFVSETVQHRIGKYVQPDHPNSISNDDALALNRCVRSIDLPDCAGS